MGSGYRGEAIYSVYFHQSIEYRFKQSIVRCKDCRHSYVHDMSAMYPDHSRDRRYCNYGTYLQWEVPDDGFCCWGERREPES